MATNHAARVVRPSAREYSKEVPRRSPRTQRGNRGREHIPLTPEILLLLDRIEPDKRKQARLLTEHLIGQKTLPCTEEELLLLLERKAGREIKRQHAARETASNRAAT